MGVMWKVLEAKKEKREWEKRKRGGVERRGISDEVR